MEGAPRKQLVVTAHKAKDDYWIDVQVFSRGRITEREEWLEAAGCL